MHLHRFLIFFNYIYVYIYIYIYVFVFHSKFDIPQDEIAREIIKHHNLKRLGDQWRNWKHALKAKHFDKSKTATQTVAKTPNIVNRQDYAKLVDSWFRGNHGFKNWYGERTKKVANYQFYGRTRVRPMVELMTS